MGGVKLIGETGSRRSRIGRRVGSSNRDKITRLESPATVILSAALLEARLSVGVAIDSRCGADSAPRPELKLSAYSGRCWNEVGFMMTLNVPGAEASAFLSRSSSVVSIAKGGRSSAGEPILDGADEMSAAVACD